MQDIPVPNHHAEMRGLSIVLSKTKGQLMDMVINMKRLVELMWDWAQWQKGYRGESRGYPSKTPGLSTGGYVSKTFDEMYEDSMPDKFKVIDTLIEDLSPAHKSAVFVRYGISTVTRYPRDNYSDLLLEAHSEIMDKLFGKGIAF